MLILCTQICAICKLFQWTGKGYDLWQAPLPIPSQTFCICQRFHIQADFQDTFYIDKNIVRVKSQNGKGSCLLIIKSTLECPLILFSLEEISTLHSEFINIVKAQFIEPLLVSGYNVQCHLVIKLMLARVFQSHMVPPSVSSLSTTWSYTDIPPHRTDIDL